jgi:GT2 family glycosyltransferase
MKICTVVVTYNRLDLLKDAISALKVQSLNHDILIINNGSTDGTTEYLNSCKNISVINQDNVGGAGGFYTGIKYACEHGYDYAWVMDDDVLPDKDALRSLVEKRSFLEAVEDEVGYVCSYVVNAEGKPVNVPTVDCRGDSVTNYSTWHKYLSRGIARVQISTFVSVLIPCKIVKEIGLPYKEFFIWGDDTEYTNRISSKYPSFLISESLVTHLRAGNGAALSIYSMNSPQRIKMYSYYVRNHHFLNREVFKQNRLRRIYSYCIEFATAFKLLIRGDLSRAKAMTKGCVNGLFFNPHINYPSKQ